MSNEEINVGDKVCKATGYHYVGEVVGKYLKTTGEVRYDIEFVGIGMLHIFGGNGLIKVSNAVYSSCKTQMEAMCTLLEYAREQHQNKLDREESENVQT